MTTNNVCSVLLNDLREFIPNRKRRVAVARTLDRHLQYAVTACSSAFPDDTSLMGLDFKQELNRLAHALGATTDQVASVGAQAHELASVLALGEVWGTGIDGKKRNRERVVAALKTLKVRRFGCSNYAKTYTGVFRRLLALELTGERDG